MRAIRNLLTPLAVTLILAGCGAPLGQAAPPESSAPPGQAATELAPSQSSRSPEPGCGLPARQHLEGLANGIGARPWGTRAEADGAAYITQALSECGYAVATQDFRVGARSSANVIARHQGEDPSREIIVGAHYDSVTSATGADDNASGVAALLDLAARIRQQTTPYTITFVAFGAEEADEMYGSLAYVEAMTEQEVDAVVAMINLDALAAGDIAYVHGDNTTTAGNALIDWVKATLEVDLASTPSVQGLDLDHHERPYLWDDSDYFSFHDEGIPFLYLEATNWNLGDQDGFTQVGPVDGVTYGREGEIYHTRFDSVSYIDSIPPAPDARTGTPGRIDDRLRLFGDILLQIVTDPTIPVP